MLEHENGKCWGKGKNQWEVKKTSGSEEFGERGGGWRGGWEVGR